MLVASADCRDLAFAGRLADVYNADPGRTGPAIELITNSSDPKGGTIRVVVSCRS